MKKTRLYRIPEEEPIKVPRFKEEAGFYATTKSSAIMSKIHSKNTKAEIRLRKTLWGLGYRYRLYAKDIVGKPDIIFPKHKLIVFIDGDFWHGYNWREKKEKLISNKAYWIPKIERNMQRDIQTTRLLVKKGWTVFRFWEHEIEKQLEDCIQKILQFLNAE